MEHQEIIVATDDGLRAGCERKLQILVVLRIAAIGDTRYGLEPEGRTLKDFQDALATPAGDRAGKLRAAENLGNFGADEGRCVEDDQSTVRGSRRSAL